MAVSTHAGMIGTVATPAEVGAKHIRCGHIPAFTLLAVLAAAGLVGAGAWNTVLAQPPPSNAPAPNAPASAAAQAKGQLPVDPWPVQIDLSNATVLVYSPQVNSWDGNALDFRSAVGVKAAGTGAETFGVIWATARTQVDRVTRTVSFEDLKIVKRNFPALPGNGQAYITELDQRFATEVRTVALDRLKASLAVTGVKPPSVATQNDPPRIIVSYSPAILVPSPASPSSSRSPATHATSA